MTLPSSYSSTKRDNPSRHRQCVVLTFPATSPAKKNTPNIQCSLCQTRLGPGKAGKVEASALWDGLAFCCLEECPSVAATSPAGRDDSSSSPPTLRHVFHTWCLDGYLLNDDVTLPNIPSSPCPISPQECVPLTLTLPTLTETSVIGIDVGGVIRSKDDSLLGDDNCYSVTSEPNPGAVHVTSTLVQRLGKNQVWIVSKASEMVASRTLEWFRHIRWYERTGMDPTHVLFCRKRTDKAPICQSRGITHFLDDHTEVLKHLTTVPHRILFAPDTKELLEKARTCPQAHVVDGWKMFGNLLIHRSHGA